MIMIVKILNDHDYRNTCGRIVCRDSSCIWKILVGHDPNTLGGHDYQNKSTFNDYDCKNT